MLSRTLASPLNRQELHTLERLRQGDSLRNHGMMEGLRKIMGHVGYAVLQHYVHLVNDDVMDEHARVSPLEALNF